MSRTHHRLDLVCVPTPWSRQLDPAAVAAALRGWRTHPEGLIAGGFGGVRLDEPGGRVLYANAMGGFRARCPSCGRSVARDFAAAVERWKAGEDEPELGCGACGAVVRLCEVDCAPAVVRGSGAVVFSDVGGAALRPDGERAVRALIGPFTVVLRRS